ncbi:recombinase family protein [bacterium]|nr:recombinase family protein [bacterium]
MALAFDCCWHITPGIDLYFHRQAIDTTTPSGKSMFQMCGICAEFERGIFNESKGRA